VVRIYDKKTKPNKLNRTTEFLGGPKVPASQEEKIVVLGHTSITKYCNLV
jgi:hypothetical protein